MLVLWRKKGQRIYIGDDIVIKVTEFRPGKVGIGIEAPPRLAIDREEVRESKLAERGGDPDRAA